MGVVVTTIGTGQFLEQYARAVKQYGHAEDVTIYVIADLNTPPICRAAADAQRAEGVDVRYVDVAEQESFMGLFPALARRIPYRSDNRRNIGYLLALRDGKDVVVSVDDDNLPIEGEAFFEEHATTGTRQRLSETVSANGWFNVGSLLEAEDFCGRRMTLHPRGFPFARRTPESGGAATGGELVVEGVVGVNVGLWLGEPDVDAVTRLATRCQTHAGPVESVFLGPGQRTPINSQNTALAIHAVPAYYFALQGRLIEGIRMDRFGDIFSGYFVQMCAEAVGHRIRLGLPCVRQERNAHNLFRDLSLELPGMVLLEAMVPLLERRLPRCTSYVEAYRSLAEDIDVWSTGTHGFMWDHSAVGFFRELTETMRLWTDACVDLAGGEGALHVEQPA